ncbi:MAG: glutathione-regulated potassium-efflux system protein KefB, partial [Rhodospirillaceae bacterium]|nr:glutathione-regulated potassium-efflux system protein KefB [Rhodospirillaceae bacterium]
ARDRNHAAQLMRLGIDRVVRETFAGSLEIATHALQGLGVAAQESHLIVDRFQEHDEAMLRDEVAPAQPVVPVHASAQSEGETAMQLEGLFSRDEKIEEDSDD